MKKNCKFAIIEKMGKFGFLIILLVNNGIQKIIIRLVEVFVIVVLSYIVSSRINKNKKVSLRIYSVFLGLSSDTPFYVSAKYIDWSELTHQKRG